MTTKKKAKPSRRASRRPLPLRRARVTRLGGTAGAAIIGLVAALLAVWILGADDRSKPDAAAEQGPVHVHGLGIDPADGALYIATHTGMWRLARGERVPRPVGESRQDTMGFTVAAPRNFLGSGHPDNLDEPPLLGLIESTDSGATWKPISLVGEADFHVLRAVGKRIYGYDVSQARLMVSRDRGRTWTERQVPARVLDLVPAPTSPERLVAATETGLLASPDAGSTWSRIGSAVGLLGWPARDRLYVVTAGGDVLVSEDSARTWSRVGAVAGQPAAFLAHASSELYVAVHGGGIVRSRDGGRTWERLTS